MFFSIIIPTYNPLNYIQKLLNSIITNKCTDEVEIILADDCSTESLDILLETYSDLNIRIILNKEHLGFPRAGRQNGLNAAKGKWIMFADQDDYFEDNALDKLKTYIENRHLKNCIFTPFIVDYPDTQEKITNHFSGWTHGKLFENIFLRQYNIKYSEVKYHEDTCFMTNIQCLLIDKDITYYDLDYTFYHWIQDPNSLSKTNNYIINGIKDYASEVIFIIFSYFKKYTPNDSQYLCFFKLFISAYFRNYYYQQYTFIRENKQFKEIKKEWNEILYSYMKEFRHLSKLKNNDIIKYIREELPIFYNDIRTDHCKYIPFFEYETFEQWLNKNFPD